MTVEMRTPRYTTQVRELPVAQAWRAGFGPRQSADSERCSCQAHRVAALSA
ncbi:DUF4113 domain-containing protein [Methylobacterium sp. R2-1]|uniref:DUF4113 domain-containing protein n=1 Tax=Methylobacterium sp. R2-1 TaxID=2587064 RepID=UPI001FEDE572|nr:DUF4113 domain-containing protein [Methylobacterium sp. R2-1]